MKSHNKILKDNLNNDTAFLKKLKFDKLIDESDQKIVKMQKDVPVGTYFAIALIGNINSKKLENIRNIFIEFIGDEDDITLELKREYFLDKHADYYFIFSTQRLLTDEKIKNICNRISYVYSGQISIDVFDGKQRLKHLELTEKENTK